MRLRYLKLVQAVACTGSLSKASGTLCLSQPALSHQLRDLEDYCRAPVFKRIGKKMILTELGETILQTADTVLAEVENLNGEIRKSTEMKKLRLSLAASCYTGYFWLPPIIREFYEMHPGSEVNISHEAVDDPLAYLLAGKIDLAIISRDVTGANIACRPAFPDEIHAIVPNGHDWAGREYIEPAEFADETVID